MKSSGLSTNIKQLPETNISLQETNITFKDSGFNKEFDKFSSRQTIEFQTADLENIEEAEDLYLEQSCSAPDWSWEKANVPLAMEPEPLDHKKLMEDGKLRMEKLLAHLKK
jgi:hypothetical protein